jgi:hypothetical protein
MAMRLGRYQPRLQEGEYIAVSQRGQNYRFNDRTLGHELREIKAFMGKLDDKPMPSLREAQAAVQEKRQKEIMASESKHEYTPGNLSERENRSVQIGRGSAKVIAFAFEFVSDGFEKLFGRSISREDRTLAEVTERENENAGRRSKRDRGEDERDR